MTYDGELEVAITAAREAGHLLHAEARRPGGPRGGGSHADVDDEMEALIVQRLHEAFPDDGIVAEEGGSRTGPSGRAWLVDPHDGTSYFLEGRRETSVSIGLVDGCDLVAGVVLMPCLEMLGDHDRLREVTGGKPLEVSWSRDGGLMSNGGPVAEPPAVSGLTENSLVLISASAMGTRLRRNETTVSPARVFSCASIATRLALVATGAADVALTIRNGLAAWDLAAGQALLQGAGGDIVGPEGSVITWEGAACPGECLSGYFGARSLELARDVASRYAREFGL